MALELTKKSKSEAAKKIYIFAVAQRILLI